eukprot:1814097-Rhodomonas_salina.2
MVAMLTVLASAADLEAAQACFLCRRRRFLLPRPPHGLLPRAERRQEGEEGLSAPINIFALALSCGRASVRLEAIPYTSQTPLNPTSPRGDVIKMIRSSSAAPGRTLPPRLGALG